MKRTLASTLALALAFAATGADARGLNRAAVNQDGHSQGNGQNGDNQRINVVETERRRWVSQGAITRGRLLYRCR